MALDNDVIETAAETLATNGKNNPDFWRKIIKIAIAILTAIAGALGVTTAHAAGVI